MSALLARISALPRVVVWAIIAAIVLVVYFAIVDPALAYINSVTSRADKIERHLARDASFADPKSEDSRTIELSRTSFGTPARPGSPGATPEALYRVVDRVLKEHDVTDAAITEREAQVQSDAMLAVTGTRSARRFILEIAFDADPQTALDVLAALEQAPEVSAVGRVRFDKLTSRVTSATETEADMLRVTLAPELWSIGPASSGGSQ